MNDAVTTNRLTPMTYSGKEDVSPADLRGISHSLS